MRTKIVTHSALAVTMLATLWSAGISSPQPTAQRATQVPGVRSSLSAANAYTCTVDILYTANNGLTENYQKSFQLAVGGTFVDDFSTAFREHVFTASATQQGAQVVFDVDYFSDVTSINAIDLDTSLTMRTNQRSETQSGRHRFFTSSSGGYTVSYTLGCERN